MNSATPPGQARVPASVLADFSAALLAAAGVPERDARITADALVAADLDGIPSHGVMLLPMYLSRLADKSVQARATPVVGMDIGALVNVDADHCLGQVSSTYAVGLAVERARQHGIGMVAVRHGFHFGAAAYWVRQVCAEGMIGIAMCNTRPLMPAPGGAERVVGNNPLAIGFPAEPGEPVVVDMAMSATAMGKIRIAQARGVPIPEGWATDDKGRDTTSAADAIAGMLLPAAGPKGFGLAVAIDLLCGAVSGGAMGGQVTPLYAKTGEHYDCSHTFMAIDAGRLDGSAARRTSDFATTIRASKAASGTTRVYAPGDLEAERRRNANGHCLLDISLLHSLNELASQLRIAARINH